MLGFQIWRRSNAEADSDESSDFRRTGPRSLERFRRESRDRLDQTGISLIFTTRSLQSEVLR